MIWLTGNGGGRVLIDERMVKPMYSRTQATPQAWPVASRRFVPGDGAGTKKGGIAVGGNIGVFGSWGDRAHTDSGDDASVWVMSDSALLMVDKRALGDVDYDAASKSLDAGERVLLGAGADGMLSVVDDGAVCQVVEVCDRYVVVSAAPRLASGSTPDPEPPVTRFKVTYTDGCGGEAFADEVHEADEGSATPAFGGRAERDGYDFAGWDPEVAQTVTADATYTAKWEKRDEPEPVTHVVSFDSGAGSEVESQTVADGAKATRPADPTNEGFTFVGWYKDAGLSEEFDFDTPVTSDITLHAKWSKDAGKTFTVTFDSNGGSAVETQAVAEGDVATRPADPEKAGSAFQEWTLDGETYDFSTPVTADVTLVAFWRFVWDVTYVDGCGGEAFKDVAYSGILDGDATPSFDSGGKEPTRPGYLFAGWDPEVAKTVTANATYTAKWDEVRASVDGREYASVSDAVAGAADGATVSLASDSSEAVTIPEGKSVTLDLAGHTLTSDVDVLTVNGTLTISGDGVIASAKNKRAAVVNNGTLTVAGGTIRRDGEKGTEAGANGNSYYTVLNHGDMTVSGGSIENSGGYSSCVSNGWYDGKQNAAKTPSTLTITGGSITGGLNTVKNDDWGVLRMTGGSVSGAAVCSIMNVNDAIISGGSVTAGGKRMFANGWMDDDMDKGELSITGGDFTLNGAELLGVVGDAKKPGTFKVSGGTFDAEVDASHLADGCTQEKNDDGKWEVRSA